MDNNKETNLFDLCKSCWKLIKRLFLNLWNLCLVLIHAGLRQWKIVIPILLLGIAFGYYYARPSNRAYKVNGVLVLNGPTVDVAKKWYENLGHDIWYNECHPYNQLGITKEEYFSTSNWKGFYMADCNKDGQPDLVDFNNRISASDTTQCRLANRLYISFTTKRPDLVPQMEEKILAYMNNNEQFQAAYDIYHRSQLRRAQYENEQVEKLDSLTSAFYFQSKGQEQVQSAWGPDVVMGRREVKLFLTEIDKFLRIKTEHERDLCYNTAPVVLENHLFICSHPINGRVKSMIIACILAWLLGCLIGLCVENKEKVSAWMKQ